MRKLKYHEFKLLKKADFLQWKKENNLHETRIIRRYHIQKPEDYHQYNKLCGRIKKLADKILQLDPADKKRIEYTDILLNKLYDMGVIPLKKSLEQCGNITVSSLCRRRLAVVLVRLKYAETLKEAVTLIEQGHIRIGPQIVTDPALLVTRNMEDFITWTDHSKIKRKIRKYNDQLDDYDLL
eukprot:jgi/Galph1/2951/GphlegSOOS_G1627.1